MSRQSLAWRLLLLLVLSIFLNYVDRGRLSVAEPLLSKEQGLSPSEMGKLFSAFFWTYALFQLFGIAGWLADRFPVGWVLAGGFFIWSGSTIATGLVSSFTALYLMRLLLGAGESVAYPCYSRILASELPTESLGFANSLLDAGSKMGPALGTLAGGLLISQTGWRVFFIVLGIASMLWLIPWLIWMPRSGATHKRQEQGTGPTVAQILKQRSAWGTFLGHFCGNYFWFFLFTWLPSYLVKERDLSMERMAFVGSSLYFAIAAATVTAGTLSDRWIRRGAPATRVRKSIVAGGLACALVILPVAMVQNLQLSLLLLLLACLSFGTYASNHWAIMQTLSGPQAAGRWTSVMNGIGNLAGIVAPWVTGVVVERTGSFHLAFVVAGLVALLGAVMWGFVVGEVRPVPWKQAQQEV